MFLFSFNIFSFYLIILNNRKMTHKLMYYLILLVMDLMKHVLLVVTFK